MKKALATLCAVLALSALFTLSGCSGGGGDSPPATQEVSKAGTWDQMNWDEKQWQ